jgi:hypothetical protein
MFDQENALAKVVRLVIDVMRLEVLAVDQRLPLNMAKWVGRRLCCRSSDSRVADTIAGTAPAILRAPGLFYLTGRSAGLAEISVWAPVENCLIAAILIGVGEVTREGKGQKLLKKAQFDLKCGESAVRRIPYINSADAAKVVRVTSTHPALITFDPSEYEIAPRQSIHILAKFMAVAIPEEVDVFICIEERSVPSPVRKYYKFHITYKED